MSADAQTKMTHRFLGNSGLLVSELGLGAWMQYKEENTVDAWYEMMKTAFQNGINFFDASEMYANGNTEILQGGAVNKGIAEGIWSREDLVLTTKIFHGSKGIETGTKASLERMKLDYVDVFAIAQAPIEETVRAIEYAIEQRAFYWGTSEWLPADFAEACEIADRLGLIRPIVEQAQYDILHRSRVEYNYLDLYKLALHKPHVLKGVLRNNFKQRVATAEKLKPIAAEIGCTLAQMAIAWAVSNKNVSTVLVGASRPSQLEENLKALNFVNKITPEVKAKIDEVVNFVPTIATMNTFAHIRDRHL